MAHEGFSEGARQHKAQKDEGIPNRRRGLEKVRRAALAKRKEAAERVDGSPAPETDATAAHRAAVQPPAVQAGPGGGAHSWHLTTLLALLQCHEKYNKGGIEKLTGLQLPTEREWNMYTAVEVRDVARYCGGGGFVLQRGLLLFTSTTGCFPRQASVGLPFTVQYSVDRFAAEFCHGRVLNPLLPITHTNPKHIPPISGAESPQP